MTTKRIIVERDVDIKMRDSVILRADVYRPDASEPVPVLLERTPYGKSITATAFALLAAERGYSVVIQDTRGRWASEGEDYPFIYDMDDGYDTVEWAAHQPWANGKLGMFGLSYTGYTQLAAATRRPPSLKAIVPTQTMCEPYDVTYHGGALALAVGVTWNLVYGVFSSLAWYSGSEEQRAQLLSQVIQATDGMSQGQTFNYLPLSDMPLIGREGFKRFFADCIAHPLRHDDYWQRVRCPYEGLGIPALHIGGWYDIFIDSTLRDYAAIRDAGNTRQKMLIGPWVHAVFNANAGEVDFGLQASDYLVLLDEIRLRWFDYWLKGIDNGIMEEEPVRIFVMGENRWRSESAWPLARTRYVSYYLHSGGAANTLHGDGTLAPHAPSEESVDTFLYDPRNPVPTRGGGLCCWDPALPRGAFDQRAVEARPDVLVYSTSPLEQDVEVTGPIEVHLWAASSAPDTDFTAKLVDVGPCGYARNLADGIIRARYRNGSAGADPLRPGEVYAYLIDLGGTSNVFKAGHRIRLELSSSNFPRFDRNLNTGHRIGEDAAMRTALQTVFHDADHPSHIVLPIIPR